MATKPNRLKTWSTVSQAAKLIAERALTESDARGRWREHVLADFEKWILHQVYYWLENKSCPWLPHRSRIDLRYDPRHCGVASRPVMVLNPEHIRMIGKAFAAYRQNIRDWPRIDEAARLLKLSRAAVQLLVNGKAGFNPSRKAPAWKHDWRYEAGREVVVLDPAFVDALKVARNEALQSAPAGMTELSIATQKFPLLTTHRLKKYRRKCRFLPRGYLPISMIWRLRGRNQMHQVAYAATHDLETLQSSFRKHIRFDEIKLIDARGVEWYSFAAAKRSFGFTVKNWVRRGTCPWCEKMPEIQMMELPLEMRRRGLPDQMKFVRGPDLLEAKANQATLSDAKRFARNASQPVFLTAGGRAWILSDASYLTGAPIEVLRELRPTHISRRGAEAMALAELGVRVQKVDAPARRTGNSHVYAIDDDCCRLLAVRYHRPWPPLGIKATDDRAPVDTRFVILSPKEMTTLWRRSWDTIKRQIDRGDIPAKQLGLRTYWVPREVVPSSES